MTQTVLDRLWGKVSPEPNTGCWLWVGARSSGGYGNMKVEQKYRAAHRVSYELYKGEIPDGLELDHLCRVRCCVNPDHLEPVTHAVNSQRGIVGHHQRIKSLSITHCPKGHEYTPENTVMRGTSRSCKKCKYEWVNQWKERHPGYMAAYCKQWREKQKMDGGGIVAI